MNKSESYACKRLSEQIKFFGGRPKRFVSIYAKKPRIRVGSKPKEKLVGLVTEIDYNKSRHEYLEGVLARHQVAMARDSYEGYGLYNQLGGMGQARALQAGRLQALAIDRQRMGMQNAAVYGVGFFG